VNKLIFLLCVFLAGCAFARGNGPTPLPAEPDFLAPGDALPSPSGPTLDANAAEARDVMLRFFTALNAGDYATAVSLYGGSYETHTTWNLDIPTTDLTALWQRACEQNGLQCLPVREVVSEEQISANVMKFIVHFRNPDSSLFVLGPCCGENETTMPPVSKFECNVARTSSGDFKVLCLPPYVP
jgi:hypothetical protein